jgi:hypothetical protein
MIRRTGREDADSSKGQQREEELANVVLALDDSVTHALESIVIHTAFHIRSSHSEPHRHAATNTPAENPHTHAHSRTTPACCYMHTEDRYCT